MSSVNGGSSFGASGRGWFVEIDHPSGYVHTPAVMDEPAPERNPVANGLPSITIPVKRNEKWSHPDFEDVAMRVYFNGQRQPIDRLEEVEQTQAATILRGRGGLELKRRFEDEVTQERTTEFVERAITETTGYEANVDRPETTREDGVHVDSATRDGDFTTRLDPAPTDPLVVRHGRVRMAQTCYPQDGFAKGSLRSQDARETLENDAYNRGIGSLLEADGDYCRFSFQTEYDIPAKWVGVRLRDAVYASSQVEVRWDGALISRIAPENPLGWREIGAFSGTEGVPDYQAAVGTNIEAGETHELEFRCTGPSEHLIDVVALYDRRFSYSWPNPGTANNGGILAGPELYPEAYDLRFEGVSTPRAVVGGRITATDGNESVDIERLGLSNTQGDDYGIVSGEDTTDGEYDVDFAAPGPSLAPLVTLARTGDDADRDEIPTTGFESQRLDSYTLHADLEDISLVVNRTFDDSLESVLTDVASDANAIFEYRRTGDVESVEWTQPGARDANAAPTVADYSVTKSTAEKVEKAVIYGATRDVDGEVITITEGEAGKSVDLKFGRIQQGSLEITNFHTETAMDEGPDFTVDYQAGVVDTKEGGRMDENTEYRASYSYQTFGEYADPAAESPRETVREAPGLTSDFAARQTAKTVVQELQTPVERGRLTASGDEGYSVVEALAAADLPGGAGSGVSGLQIREMTSRPGTVNLRVGSRRSIDEIISDIERDVSAVSRQT